MEVFKGITKWIFLGILILIGIVLFVAFIDVIYVLALLGVVVIFALALFGK